MEIENEKILIGFVIIEIIAVYMDLNHINHCEA